MKTKERRNYDRVFKLMAIELHLTGKSTSIVADQLGISADLVRRWTREYNQKESTSFPGNGKQTLSEEHKEISALRKALKEAETERDILKKAVRILA